MMRRRVLTELVFAIEIGITILLGVVIYYMASQALAGREQWAIFIAYIGALRMTLNGAALAIRAFASVSRYYPQIVRYYLFIKDMQKLDKIAACRSAARRQGVPRHASQWPGCRRRGRRLSGDTRHWSSIREPMFALVGAKLVQTGEPVASAAIDPANIRKTPAGITLISGGKLLKEQERLRSCLMSSRTR